MHKVTTPWKTASILRQNVCGFASFQNVASSPRYIVKLASGKTGERSKLLDGKMSIIKELQEDPSPRNVTRILRRAYINIMNMRNIIGPCANQRLHAPNSKCLQWAICREISSSLADTKWDISERKGPRYATERSVLERVSVRSLELWSHREPECSQANYPSFDQRPCEVTFVFIAIVVIGGSFENSTSLSQEVVAGKV